MIKYKVVGIFNLFNGVFFILSPVLMYLFVIPKLASLHEESGIVYPVIFEQTYLALIIVFILGIINIFLGSKLLSGAEETKKKYYKYGLTFMVLILALWVLYFVSSIRLWIIVFQGISNLYMDQ